MSETVCYNKLNMPGRKHRFYENRILKKYFNTERILQETQSQGGGVDGKTAWQAIELAQHPIPQWIKQELQQAIDDSEQGKRCPVFVCREKYKKDDDAIVMLRLRDYIDWHGN